MSTRKLLNRYLWLLGEFAANGPSSHLIDARRVPNQLLRVHRSEQRYARLNAKTGVVLDFFERDTPLTEQDAANLKAAAAVNKQITAILRGRRNGRTAGVAP